MGYTRQQYEDRIRSNLGDLGVLQRVSAEQIPLAFEQALLEYSNDHPAEIVQTFAGDGTTYDFDLTADAAAGYDTAWSRVVEVESPTGQRQPAIVDPRYYLVLSDGTLRFLEDTPGAGTSVAVTHTAPYPHPDDDPATDTIPARHRSGLAALAASHLARNKALEFARRQSNSVAGELIQLDPGPLFEAARALKAVYDEAVHGSAAGDDDSPSELAFAVSDIQPVFPRSIFHQRPRTPGA